MIKRSIAGHRRKLRKLAEIAGIAAKKKADTDFPSQAQNPACCQSTHLSASQQLSFLVTRNTSATTSGGSPWAANHSATARRAACAAVWTSSGLVQLSQRRTTPGRPLEAGERLPGGSSGTMPDLVGLQ